MIGQRIDGLIVQLAYSGLGVGIVLQLVRSPSKEYWPPRLLQLQLAATAAVAAAGIASMTKTRPCNATYTTKAAETDVGARRSR